jgi:hypothetical protein
MKLDLYDVFMTLRNGTECWWQGFAKDGADALEKAWEYATTEPSYQSEPTTWEIELA